MAKIAITGCVFCGARTDLTFDTDAGEIACADADECRSRCAVERRETLRPRSEKRRGYDFAPDSIEGEGGGANADEYVVILNGELTRHSKTVEANAAIRMDGAVLIGLIDRWLKSEGINDVNLRKAELKLAGRRTRTRARWLGL